MELEKLKLPTPPPPKFAVLDLDSVLFKAAQSGEQVWYKAIDENGNEVARFDSAKKYDNWISEFDIFGVDVQFGYDGDPEKLTREVEYELKDVELCYKTFDKIIKQWVKQSGCKDWIGYIGKATGMKNFRYDVATIRGYKSTRGNVRKPTHLEAVRKYASKHPQIKIVRGTVEVDDVVCAIAQKKGHTACVVGVDKDARGVVNTHVLIPDEMTKPEFSSQRLVGTLYKNSDGKVVGLGTLFWLYQLLAGDSIDGIVGCKGVGSKKAYDLLEPFSGVSVDHLPEVIAVIAELYQQVYGETYEYNHCTTGDKITASWRDIMIEMSHLVYMRKSQTDECFWIEYIPPIQNE